MSPSVHLGTPLHSCTVVQLSSSEQEIDFHMCHMSTFWSEDLVSCQFHSDLCTSNILYANQIKMKLVSNQKEKKYLFITEINWSVVQLSLEVVLPFPRSAHNWQSFQETLFYINMCFIIILFPCWKEDDICRNTLMDIGYIILYYYYEITCIKYILKYPFICSYPSSSFFTSRLHS